MKMQYLIIRCLFWRYHGDITILTPLNSEYSNDFSLICCFVETMR
jgi:hypothetical protein